MPESLLHRSSLSVQIGTHVLDHEISGIDDRQAKADRHRDTGPPLGNTQKIGHDDLELAGAVVNEVVNVLGADAGEHDQHEQLHNGHDGLDNLPDSLRQDVDQNIDAQVRMLAVGICAADEDSPDEEAGNHFFRPVNRVVKEVAHDDVGVNKHDADGQRHTGDDGVEVRENGLECNLILHRLILNSGIQNS